VTGADPVLATHDSWRRCAVEIGLDQECRSGPQILTQCELAAAREPVDKLLRLATDDLNRLHAAVAPAGFAVLLSSAEAVVVDHRIGLPEADAFKSHGACSGGIWSEAVEGTNAIGTALIEREPVIVAGDDHYRQRNRGFTCIGAPIFDPESAPLGTLTLAQLRPDGTPALRALALGIATEAARAIEERLFRSRFGASWILRGIPQSGGNPVLLAVDRDRRIVGADRHAQAAFKLGEAYSNRGLGLARLLVPRSAPAACRFADDQPMPAQEPATGTPWLVRLSAPGQAAPIGLRLLPFAPPVSGLAPSARRRVAGYVDAHLDESLPLETLARVAGLSRSHFAAAFRETNGTSPHRWVLERRIERAKALLADPALPVTEVALAAGFGSSSHFATAFREATGLRPSDYRAAADVREVG
jgi:AraC-like DNA-binding protein